MNTETQIQVVPQEALYLITKAEIDIQISTAKAFPRSMKQFLDTATGMATLTEDIAASCSYALPRQGKAIEGPSVRLAEIVTAAYKNVRSGARVIANDGKTITAQGICHDLENNNCVTVEVKRRITGKDGKTFNEDMQVVTGNAACAIAFRNAVFKVIPSAMVAEVYDRAKEVAKGTAETLVARREKAVNYAKSIGVTDKQICATLGVKKIEDIDLEKLADLRGFLSAIKNGESTAKDIFDPSANAAPVDKEAERLDMMIRECATVAELEQLRPHVDKKPEMSEAYNARMVELSGKLV